MDVREANKLPHAPVRAPQSKLHPCVDALPSLHQATQRPHISTTKLPRHLLGPASSLLHASVICDYYDYSTVRDRRGRTTRAGAVDAPAALHRLMDTDEAMNDADTHLYTTTIIMHGEREAKTKDDDHSSLIGGTPAS